MTENSSQQLVNLITATQKRLCELLEMVADDQDWQSEPQEWSFRYIAAHLATTDKECYQDRVVRISASEKPFFESYFNTGRDFSQLDLRDSLQKWRATRQEIFNLVDKLPEEKLLLSGTHAAFGKITVIDVLKLMLEHDQEHIKNLELVTAEYRTRILNKH